MSPLPNTIPNVVTTPTPDRVPPRAEETSRLRDDDRFSDRLDRETSRSEASRSDSPRRETSRSEASRSDRPDRTDTPTETASSTETDEQVIEEDGDLPETTTPTHSTSVEGRETETDLSLEAALAFLSDVDGTENSELTITTRSGETITLTPPAANPNGQAEPGSLGRWFVEASGSPSSSTLGSQGGIAGLLAKTMVGGQNATDQAPNLAGMVGQGNQSGLKLADLAANGVAQSSSQTISFADAMATANATTESVDALMGQALAKATAALEAGTGASTPVTTGPTVATGAQPMMTAVPQSTAGQAVPVTALAVEINRQAMNGKTQFEIRLDPPELGRLNVRLELDSNGQVRTHMVVERSETLDMLTTDSRSLERALQQAGMKAEPGSVTFELAQDFGEGLAQNGNQTEAGDNDGAENASSESSDEGNDGLVHELTDMSSVEAVRQQLYLTGHLDVRV